jgi:hypothetical protein
MLAGRPIAAQYGVYAPLWRSRFWAIQDLAGGWRQVKHMILERWFAFALAAAILGAAAGRAAELPAQNKKPTKAESARTCDIAGNPGVLAANGVCVRFSGYVSSQFSAGQLRQQYK